MNHQEIESYPISYKIKELPEVVQKLLPLIKKHKVLALHGELGAGKTTFTSVLCQILKTKEAADSPTFSLINQYSFEDNSPTEQIIYHTDWYRIKDEEDARIAGIEDMLQQPFALCIIEWSENAPELLPANTLHLWFALGSEPDSRTISFGAQK